MKAEPFENGGQKKMYTIAKNGESDFHIVNHQYSDETVRYAASELQKYLLKATGAVLPYFSDRCPSCGPEIQIGPDVRRTTMIEKNLQAEEFYIGTEGENIIITGGSSRGVLYGVYAFLEKYCGFYCFTDEVEVIEKTETLEIESVGLREKPAFDFRDAYFRKAFDGDFCAKNRLNSSLGDISYAKGGRVKWFNFHHSFNDLVPDTLYFDTHPEYYSEIDGKREKNSQLCLTNPDVFKIAEQTLRRWIEENPECTVFSVAQNDNQRRCTCPKCLEIERQEESPAGPIIHFVNRLAEAIEKDYPHVKLHTFAYQYSLPAPKTVVARDNVIVRLCSISCRFDAPFEVLAAKDPSGEEAVFVHALSAWASHAKELYVWDYAVNFRNYLQPFLHFHTMAENIRFFRRVGVKGVLEQGNFAYGGGASLDDLKSYLISRLLWNPDVDIEREMHRFFVGVYGKAGEYMERYALMMEKACSSSPLTIYQYPDVPFITDELVEKAEEIFAAAIAAAENETYRKRVEREFLAIRFLRITRLPLDAEGRNDRIDAFFEDVKAFGITEIRERVSHRVMKECMREVRYVKDRSREYKLYYIMQ